jgi:D-3-phosphoglycerate dehydrogenase
MKGQGMRRIVMLTNAIGLEPHALLAAHAEVRLAPATDADALIRCAAEAEVIIVRAPLPVAALAGAPRLRGVVRHGAGLDMIPVQAASELGIAVANVPGANAVSVAEYVVGQMLALTRRLNRIDETLRTQGWGAARALADDSIEASGRTVGIVGMGAIGVEVARICADGLRMKVLGLRRSTAPMPAFVTPSVLDELLARSDVVVLACPLNDSTRGLLNADRLARMKRGAFLVNVSRGPVVDEAALATALRDGPLAGAALDVFEQQPLPSSSPLFSLPNVILSTHLAGITEDSMRRVGEIAVRQTVALLRGQLPEHLVNTDAAAAVRARLASLENA